MIIEKAFPLCRLHFKARAAGKGGGPQEPRINRSFSKEKAGSKKQV